MRERCVCNDYVQALRGREMGKSEREREAEREHGPYLTTRHDTPRQGTRQGKTKPRRGLETGDGKQKASHLGAKPSLVRSSPPPRRSIHHISTGQYEHEDEAQGACTRGRKEKKKGNTTRPPSSKATDHKKKKRG